jgi:Undecaprenyl-phosphate glucose phosphotransferase
VPETLRHARHDARHRDDVHTPVLLRRAAPAAAEGHGMIAPAEHHRLAALPSQGSAGAAQAIAAESGRGWSSPSANVGGTAATTGRRSMPRARTVAPVPPLALAAGTGILDVAAVGIAGSALGQHALGGYRPEAGAILFVMALLPCIAAAAGAYAHPALFGNRRALLGALGALAASSLLLATAALALGAEPVLPPGVAILWILVGAPLLLAGRLASSTAVRALAERGRRRSVLVVGSDGAPQAARLMATLGARHDRSFRVLGAVDEETYATGTGGDVRVAGLPRLGDLESLITMIRRGEVDEVVLALPWSEEARILRILDRLAECPVDIRLAPELPAYRGRRGWWHSAREAGHLTLPHLVGRPISGLGGVLKAAEDYVLASLILAVVAVPMALIALAIRLDSPGPVLFRQRRTGFNDRDFHVLKFRTMYHDRADLEARRQVTEGDPRVTRIGAILRRTSLDELPQIFNILRGEMSIVGPRPHAPGTLAAGRPFQDVVARYAARHRVKPGLTGLAQVRGWRGPTETEEKLIRRVESDLEYIDSWSLWLDFAILLRTLLAVARMRNAL